MNQKIDGYQDYDIQQEDVALHPEDVQRSAQGKRIIRALNWFVFVKDGQPTAPVYSDCTDQSWSGTVVYGFAASLSGKARWHIMGGFWSYAWGEKHFELISIETIVGFSKKYSPHWRGGIDPTLWLETGGGYTYALLDPATEYSQMWKVVCHSWTPIGDGADPTYLDVDPAFPRPVWWAGTQSWNYVQRMVEDEKKRAEEDSDDEPPARQRAKRKTRQKTSEYKPQKRKSNAAAESSLRPTFSKPVLAAPVVFQASTPTRPATTIAASSVDSSPVMSVPRKKPRYVEIDGDIAQDTPSVAGTAISTVSPSMLESILDYAISIGANETPDPQAMALGSAPPALASAIENQSVCNLELRCSERHKRLEM
ncbi:unnamed protein product [Rhizoctonia solani]|uniref:Uncharacterized protein n=1 Tax=Rhizoctonia solani TaxID=456999 RepID=A0A8H3DQZ5_9AGAM|nr:unnamed protein product [Rhizoctonia solani]